MSGAEQNPWFTYTRTAGRITAAPANRKGWAVLIGGIAVVALLGFAAMSFAGALHPLLGAMALSVVIVAGVLVIARIALAKGRPAG